MSKPQPLKGKIEKLEFWIGKPKNSVEFAFKHDIRSAVEWLKNELEELFELAGVIQGIDKKNVKNTHNLIKQSIWEAFEDVMKDDP